jgi:hypothetical protein
MTDTLTCPLRKITIVEYVQPSRPRLESNEEAQNKKTNDINEIAKPPTIQTSSCNKRTKPSFHRGEKIYAVLKGNNQSSDGTEEWLPGRVWDFKVTHETSYGPVKAYDISEYYMRVCRYLFINSLSF